MKKTTYADDKGQARRDTSEMNVPEFDPRSIERPHRNLMTYYTLASFLLGPLFPIALIPLFFRYHTLRYSFDSEGVSMRWGILFRREVSLTYARLQDIHLTSNLVERWLGLAKVQLQTASGSAAAEMTIEGLQEFEAVRDYLYSRMRGARGLGGSQKTVSPRHEAAAPPTDELVAGLQVVAQELKAIRHLVESRAGDGPANRSSSSPAVPPMPEGGR